MRTRKATTPKTPASQEKTTPASQKKTPAPQKKSAVKTPIQSSPTVESTPETATVKSAATPSSNSQSFESPETPITPSTDSKPEPAVEQAKAPTAPGKKITKRIVRKKVLRPKNPAPAKEVSAISEKAGETEEDKADVPPKVEDATDVEAAELPKPDEVVTEALEPVKLEETGTEKGEDVEPQVKGKGKMDVDEPELLSVEGTAKSSGQVDLSKAKEEDVDDDPEEASDDVKNMEPAKESQDKPGNMDDYPEEENVSSHKMAENKVDDKSEKMEEEAIQPKGDEASAADGIEEYGDEERFVEPGDEDLQEDEEPEAGDEVKALEEEHKELAAAAKERKVKKELEIFVGGLDREVVEDDVKKTFEKVGEVVEVRLLKDPITNKNRGFAFVRFATKDQAKRALSEMKNPVIRGKRCGTAPNEDNDTLFLGNVCNTWTKEAIRQKLKEYSVEGVENITLVQDPRHEGLSRGFCFIQFACHADAMFAYKRLQKPDAVFGHLERTAKVAFAEPLQEPDPEVMAKVKSVFVDGLPPHWDEDRVRKHFKSYGDIERITLARNMSSAKRKDFGFVDFMTHEAAIACIEDVNSKELVEGNSKTKVRARLSNPLPKTQAVKGGMCGGFRIGRPSGRSFGRAGPVMNRPNFPYGRPSRGQFHEPVPPYGRRVPFRAGHQVPVPGASGRPNFGGPRDDRSFARPAPPRRDPFPLDDGNYSRPFLGRQYDDPYAYDDSHGLKRPFYMTEQDPAYMEPSRVRPRFDYTGSGRGTHLRGTEAFRDTYGAGSSFYSSGYYGPDHGARPHSSFNGRDRPYGGGHGAHGYY